MASTPGTNAILSANALVTVKTTMSSHMVEAEGVGQAIVVVRVTTRDVSVSLDWLGLDLLSHGSTKCLKPWFRHSVR